MQQPLTRQGCAIFQPIQLEQCHIMIQNMLRAPEDFEPHIRRYVVREAQSRVSGALLTRIIKVYICYYARDDLWAQGRLTERCVSQGRRQGHRCQHYHV